MSFRRYGPPLTVPRVWRRGREIVRERGWSGLVFTILGDLGYHRFLLYERSLADPITPTTPDAALVFSLLDPAELDEYLRFHDLIPRVELEERLARGDECFLARHEGRIVGTSWVSRGPHFFESMGCRYPVGPTEAYVLDSFTDPAFRGRGIAPALSVHVLERLRNRQLTRVILAIAPENQSNRRVRAKMGFRVFGRIDYVRIGRWAWHWHRERFG